MQGVQQLPQRHRSPMLLLLAVIGALTICRVLFQNSVVRSIVTQLANTSLKDEPNESVSLNESLLMSFEEDTDSSTILDDGNSTKNTTHSKDVPLAELSKHEITDYAYKEDWDTKQLCKFLTDFFSKNNSLCSLPGNATARTLLQVHFGCKDLFVTGFVGIGNWLVAFYAMRLTAKVSGNMDIIVQCPYAEAEKEKLILPWVMGTFRTSQLESNLRATMGDDDAALVCRTFAISPVRYLYPDIEYELRRMALALVGVPPKDNPNYHAVTTWISDKLPRDASYLQVAGLSSNMAEPILSGIELDDTTQ